MLDAVNPLVPPVRLASLDVFRGLTIAFMVIVNNPGSWATVYWPLLHAEWEGCTPTDLVFPFFLFIVGVAITLSKRSPHWRSAAWRASKLVLLGLFLAGYPTFVVAKWRIPGVLQRIGLVYFASAMIYKWCGGEGKDANDRRTAWRIGLVAGGLVVGYWQAIVWIPGGVGFGGDVSAGTNIGAIVDRLLMGTHLWKRTWDPEGLLSTLPAIASGLLGVLAGLWLRAPATPGRKVVGFALAGAAGLLLGGLWGRSFPMIKNLWTSSYVIYTAGGACVLFAGCYWLVDVKGVRRPMWPLVVLGTNAIALFVVSGLLTKTLIYVKVAGPAGRPVALSTWIYQHYFVPLASPMNASLLYAIANLVALYGVLWVMYRRGIFLKV